MAITVFYYKTTDILGRVRNESLVLEGGGNKDFDNASVNIDEVPFVKTRLEESANEIMVMLQAYMTEALITADNLTELGITNTFLFDKEIPDQTGLYIAYWVNLPTEFPTRMITPLDSAIKKCLVDKALYRWYDAIGRLTSKITSNDEKSSFRVRQLLNFRTSIQKTYNWH